MEDRIKQKGCGLGWGLVEAFVAKVMNLLFPKKDGDIFLTSSVTISLSRTLLNGNSWLDGYSYLDRNLIFLSPIAPSGA
jgi:hypothetical protein